jgi:hypothetical protein
MTDDKAYPIPPDSSPATPLKSKSTSKGDVGGDVNNDSYTLMEVHGIPLFKLIPSPGGNDDPLYDLTADNTFSLPSGNLPVDMQPCRLVKAEAP